MTYDRRELGIGAGIWVSAIILVFATFLALWNIYDHYKHMYYPQAQKILMVILTAPILIGWPSWVIVLVGEDVGILEVVTDIVKSLMIILFVEYTLRLIGWRMDSTGSHYDYDKVESSFSQLENGTHLCPCFGKIPLKTSEDVKIFIWRVRFAGIQYGIVFFFAAIAATLLLTVDGDNYHYGELDPHYGYFWINMIKIVVSAIAMYHLLLYLTNIHKIHELKHMNVDPKFLAVKIAFIGTQIQPTVIGSLADWGAIADTDEYDVDQITSYTTYLLLSIEMIIFAFVQGLIFPPREYKYKYSKKSVDSEKEPLVTADNQ